MSLRQRPAGLLLAVLAGTACAGQPQPSTTPDAASANGDVGAEPSEAAPPLEDDVTEPSGETDDPEPSTEAKPPKEPLASLCNKMCDAVQPKCTPLQVKGCRSTCDNYETHPPACDGVVRAALECARADKDFLFCANVVPDSCAKEFLAINTCKETGAPPVQAQAAGLPDGWERYRGEGFSVVVPQGMKANTKDGQKVWTVQARSGESYEVAIHPPPSGTKLDNRAFLRAANKLFRECAPKLKLHALVERPGHTSIQFNTTCPDGSRRIGRMHVVDSKMYVLTAYVGTDENASTDPFVYSFERN